MMKTEDVKDESSTNGDEKNDWGKGDEKNRDRLRRGDRLGGNRGGGGGGGGGGNNARERSPRERKGRMGGRETRRILVSNVPYEYKWQELKDLFRSKVGEVSFVELFMDEYDKPRGCGIVEFEKPESVEKAIEKMHRYELKGRNLVVKEDFDGDRKSYGWSSAGKNADMKQGRDRDQPVWGAGGGGMGGGSAPGGIPSLFSTAMPSAQQENKWGNTYGLSPQFLEYLWIQGPLINKVFVANLDYKVDQKKLLEVFKLAGRVLSAELNYDKEGKSRGFGTVEYSHPVEAIQAISLLNNQMLYDRRLTVRMDRPESVTRLPEGLKGIGMGLGANGGLLRDVANNLPNMSTINSNFANNAVQNIAGVPSPFATAAAALTSTNPLSSLGVTGNQLTNALGLAGAAAAGLGLGSAGVDRLIDGTAARRQLDMGGGGLGGASGIGNLPSLMGSSMGGAGNLGMNNISNLGGGSGFGSGLGSALGGGVFGGNNQLNTAPPSNLFSNTTNLSGGNLGGGRNDFDTLSAALSGGYNSQSLGDRDFTRNRNLPSNLGQSGGGGGGGNNNNTNQQMTDSVAVRNLPANVTWQMLKDKFGDAGHVKFAEMRGKDMGLVQFGSKWEANRAISQFDRTRWDGRNLEVSFY